MNPKKREPSGKASTASYKIHGMVTGAGGKPIADAEVTVWRQFIRKREPLAKGRTSKNGQYTLKYIPLNDPPTRLLIVVEARGHGLRSALLSPLTVAQPDLQIDLGTELADRSEFTTLMAAIDPLLDRLPLVDVVQDAKHQDVTFLADKAGLSVEQIMRVVIAARLEAAFKTPAAAFYAFLRQNVPSSLPSPLLDASNQFTLIDSLVQNIGSLIFQVPATTQQDTLTGAVALDLIGPHYTTRIAEFVSQLQALRVTDMLNRPYAVGSSSLGQILAVAKLSKSKQQAFATALAVNTQTMTQFWAGLGDGKSTLTPDEASAVQQVLSIGSFVKNFVPLTQKLYEGFSAGTYTAMADLARLSLSDWTAIISLTGTPSHIDATPNVSAVHFFAQSVYAQVAQAYPTAAISSRATNLVAPELQAPLGVFFKNNASLDLISDNITAFIEMQGSKAFSGIKETDQPAVLAAVRGFQRVLRITPIPDTAQTILGLGVTSATQIAAMGERQWVTKATAAGISTSDANSVFQTAASRYANVVSHFMNFNRGAVGVWPKAMGDVSDMDAPAQQVLQRDSSLAALFGSQDYCATSDCTSILSPAAYLCDLLMWLSGRMQATGSALDVLDSRRPDIRHLLLNCANSDTEVPYIDLVLELLADKIDPPITATLAVAIDANSPTIFVTALTGNVYPKVSGAKTSFYIAIGAEILLVDNLSILSDSWPVLRAQQNTTAASAPAGTLVIVLTPGNPLWKQTSDDITTAQLNAAPEYLNTAAFTTLFNATYPQSLPYSAGLDELRIYLQQWNLPLWQLQQALLPLSGASADLLTAQAGVASERLGMNPIAQSLVTVKNFVSANVAWNTKDTTVSLSFVPVFLQAASITYEQLLELLEVAWIQQNLNLSLASISDNCDTSKQSLTPSTTLAEDLTNAATQTVITVTSALGFPAPPFLIAVDLTPLSATTNPEILQVTAVAGPQNQTWTVVRAQNGSSALSAPANTALVMLLDQDFLDRAHRFLRLWRSSGFKMWELDLWLSSVLGNSANPYPPLDQTALIALQTFWQLQVATGLAVDQLCAFFGNIDAAAHRDPDGSTTTSLYARLFLNPAITSVFPDPDIASLPTGGAPADTVLSHHLPAIQAALGISAADATLLFGLTDNTLTLDNLSLIYRVNSLAVASGFSISDLFTVATLLNPTTGGAATTLAAPLPAANTGAATTISVEAVIAGPAFPPGNFYVRIGNEILWVISIDGAIDNTSWTVLRAQLGTTAAPAATGAAVSSDLVSPASALASCLASPAATLAFLAKAKTIRQQTGLTLDAISYVLTPPASITGGWTTTTQMTQSDIAGALSAVQSAVATALAASTTLTSPITATATTIAVASNTGFPPPNFYVSIGAETVLVQDVSGTGNTFWTVLRGQNSAAAPAGATVTALTPSTTLTTDITDYTQTTITVASDDGFPPTTTPVGSPGFYINIGSETLQVTDVGATKTSWTVVRGQQGSTPVTASSGDKVAMNGSEIAGTVIAAVAATAHSATSSALAPDVTAVILKTLKVPVPSSNPPTLLDVLSAPGFTSSTDPITFANFESQFLALQLFDKVAVLVRGLRLTANPDLSWLLANAGVYGGLDFTQLPVVATQPVLALSPLLTTFLTMKLARLWISAPPSSPVMTLYDVITIADTASSNETEVQVALATITGWPLADIAAFAGSLSLTFPDNYTQPATYDALRTLEAMAKMAGASASQIVSWGGGASFESSAEDLAATARAALKAQQSSNDAWLALAPKLMNPLRERRSAALQAYLIALTDAAGNPIYGDVNGLFDYFLIDTQMTSCEPTSRLVQAYIAVQIFVERCLMNLEAPDVIVDLTSDDKWSEWQWMKRFRIWQANREVFLYPENWLIESQRPSNTEIYQQFEQEVRQGQSTTDYLETVVLNYIDRLDGLAHLLMTGTCSDPDSDSISPTVYVVARTLADPPVFYLRTSVKGSWDGWTQIPLDIKAHHAVPAIYRGRVCLFWISLKVSNEPRQQLPETQFSTVPAKSGNPSVSSSAAPSQEVDRYVTIDVNFSMFRNGSWAPAQTSKGKLFDKPLLTSMQVSDTKTIEALYTLKIKFAASTPGYGENLYVDVFRSGIYSVQEDSAGANGDGTDKTTTSSVVPNSFDPTKAIHIGRAVFDGRFSDLELNPALEFVYNGSFTNINTAFQLLAHAQQVYGPDAQSLLPLINPDSDLVGEPNLLPQAGALQTAPTPLSSPPTTHPSIPLTFSEQNVGTLLGTAQVPFRVVGPSTDIPFDPTSYFFFQDNRRCYYVECKELIEIKRGEYPYRWVFHPFYHPFTRLFWNQLSGGGFELLYDPTQQFPDADLQENPDKVDPDGSDEFSFSNYGPSLSRVSWDHDDVTDEDRQFLDFRSTAAFSVYNWELFYHVPLFVAQLLSQNQQFEDAQKWFHYIFNPSRQAPNASTVLHLPITDPGQSVITVESGQGFPTPFFPIAIGDEILFVIAVSPDLNPEWTVLRGQQGTQPTTSVIPAGTPVVMSNPAPQRFWLPKPLHNLTSSQIINERINQLLENVNQGDAPSIYEVNAWRLNPFNPFLLADSRMGVPYMKSTVMSYLDNLIAWADNLFSTESREALSEATLIYVLASEILGPAPTAVTPPSHFDQSFDQLQPSLDAFANAMVNIENVIDPSTSGNSVSGGTNGMISQAQTFYFKIPSNDTLLNYWTTVADRLYKLRHCQNIAGQPLDLALFDAPIDPGLLIKARAAGVDLSSVLSNSSATLPNYRFTALYSQAADFVGAVRTYGGSLQAAIEKADGDTLALLQQTTAQQLLIDGAQILDWQVEQAQSNLDALGQTLALAQQKYDFNNSQPMANSAEEVGITLAATASVVKAIAAATQQTAAVVAVLPEFTTGMSGFGGTPVATATYGGEHAGKAAAYSSRALVTGAADIATAASVLSNTIGSWQHRQDNWKEAAAEANIQIAQANIQIQGAQSVLQVMQKNQTLHDEQVDNIQKQIDFLNSKFTNTDLYNWMVTQLSDTYFKSYQLAYQMCKQLERCYQFELGVQNTSFVQFGYWDSLYKGLLSGETLNHDLRRMQASYLQKNARRYELSRYVSLETINPDAFRQLIAQGWCTFDLLESMFDKDYPGHYNRRLTRVSVTVVYPNPGKFDNVKLTLTMTANKVRINTDISGNYQEAATPLNSDSRFLYAYAANSQKIALGNGQDDPGLFLTTLSNNLADQRYLPFENAGAISSWRIDMPQINNEIDLSTVSNIVLHLYYTALDGGSAFQAAVQT